MAVKDVEFIEIKGNIISINIVLEDEAVETFRRDWSKVRGCQAPLIGTYKNGLSLFIPWIMEDTPGER